MRGLILPCPTGATVAGLCYAGYRPHSCRLVCIFLRRRASLDGCGPRPGTPPAGRRSPCPAGSCPARQLNEASEPPRISGSPHPPWSACASSSLGVSSPVPAAHDGRRSALSGARPQEMDRLGARGLVDPLTGARARPGVLRGCDPAACSCAGCARCPSPTPWMPASVYYSATLRVDAGIHALRSRPLSSKRRPLRRVPAVLATNTPTAPSAMMACGLGATVFVTIGALPTTLTILRRLRHPGVCLVPHTLRFALRVPDSQLIDARRCKRRSRIHQPVMVPPTL